MKFKAILALSITALFILTGFAVLMPVQNSTLSAQPIPYLYGQLTAKATPYIATSNGLTYTVEPNGTYLWNGHYLRAPPVAYPKVPTIAPDGLPYGAVGPVGAQGHIGPYSFTKGTAQIKGVSPNTTTGGDTLINANTFWGNETISLVGNVTIDPGYSLTIYNSNISFVTPSSSNIYTYEINLTAQSSVLSMRHGTVLMQSNPASSNSWLIQLNSTSTGSTVMLSNVTLIMNATTYVFPTNGEFAQNNLHDILIGINGTLQYSEVIASLGGSWKYAISPITASSTYIMNHDNFTDVPVNVSSSNKNDSFYNSYTHIPTITSFLTFSGQWFNITWGGPFLNIADDVHFSNNMIRHANITNDASPGMNLNAGISVYINNTSWTSCWARTPLTTYDQGGHYFLKGSNNNVLAIYLIHDSVINFTQYIGMNVGGIAFQKTGLSVQKYGLFSGYHVVTAPNLNGAFGTNFWQPSYGEQICSWNIFANITSAYSYKFPQGGNKPQNNPYAPIGSAGPLYGFSANSTMSHNYFVNGSGYSIFTSLEATIPGYHLLVYNNTIINLTDGAQGFVVSMNSAPAYNTYIFNNSAYGVYGDSLFISGQSADIPFANISSNQVYDLDITSYTLLLGPHVTANVSDMNNVVIGLFVMNTSVVGGTFTKQGFVNISNSSLPTLILSSFTSSYYYNGGIRLSLPEQFNITLHNTYINSNFLSEYVQGGPSGGPGYVLDNLLWGSFGGTTKEPNPYFLNLTGYLGIYQGQTYNINTSNIKGETTLPIYMNGYQVAAMSAATGHYNFTASVNTGTLQYSVSANSASDQPVTLYWQGQTPNIEYAVAMYDHGSLIDYTNVTSNANGVVTFQYNPATMPLDPVFQLTTFTPIQPPPNGSPISTWNIILIGIAVIIVIGVVIPLVLREK